jgi:N-acetylmuramoyl-L-alanine amidase
MRAAVSALCLLALAAPSGAAGPAVRVPIEAGVVAGASEELGLFLEVLPQKGEGLLALARRICGGEACAEDLAQANGGARELVAGMRYRVAFGLLSPEWQTRTIRALFPKDQPRADGWRHQALGVGPLERESLWRLAEWFTGKGENFRAIREYNELADDDVPRGAAVTIPAELLRPALHRELPPAEIPWNLEYATDRDGPHAVYRLRPGEALYSAVVVRFTGRVFAVDVNALAAEIAKRSGIPDVTDIPIGYRVKIPFDVLQPEFLPPDHPRRKEYEASRAAAAQFSNQVRSRGLAGITVVLDAGHGGQDVGASMGGVWESLYVYDIALRARRLLEAETAAKVHLTTRDGADLRIRDADVLPYSRGHVLLTTPPYPLEDHRVGVNLRWYLANSLHRQALKADPDAQKVVFLSIHADSLHPSLRGAMAYVPAADLRKDSYGMTGAVYAARKEVQESPQVSFPYRQRVESEGLSRELARQVIGAFEDLGLAVHPYLPVRDKIIRGGGAWVPAVLRYNSVPGKILLEVCNLANEEDRRLIRTRAFRQRVAGAIVAGLLAYYGQNDDPAGGRIAQRAR